MTAPAADQRPGRPGQLPCAAGQRPCAGRRADSRRSRQCKAAPVPDYLCDLSPRQATPDAPFRGIDRRSSRAGAALAGRTPGRASIPGHRPAPHGQPGSGGFRRAQATACPGGGVIHHEGGSIVKKLLLAAGLALTGLLTAAAPALTAAAPALAAASAPNFGYYDNQPIEYQATFPGDAGAGNVLNFIPIEVGYTGGAWNLQIFHWNPGVTPAELSSDTDILAAVAAGKGTLEITSTLVRCPVINFSALR